VSKRKASPGDVDDEPDHGDDTAASVAPATPVPSTGATTVGDETLRKVDHKLLYMLLDLQGQFEQLQHEDAAGAAFGLLKERLGQLTTDDVRAIKRQKVLRAEAPVRTSWD